MNDDFERVQHSGATHFMRELQVLRSLGALAGRFRPLRILSFGCSIGDELASLHAFFPEARIFGCDVNDVALAAAARVLPGKAEVFRSSPSAIAARGPFDIICAMSSLCLHPIPKGRTIRDEFPFPRFEELTGFLINQLVPGGAFALVNPSYFIQDTAHAAGLRPVRRAAMPMTGHVPRWNTDHTLALGYHNGIAGQIPCVADARSRSDEECFDQIFVKEAGPPIELPDEALNMALGLLEGRKPLSTWTRSNFGGWPGKLPAGALEFRRAYAIWTGDKVGEEASVMITQVTTRDRFDGLPPTPWGPVFVNVMGPVGGKKAALGSA